MDFSTGSVGIGATASIWSSVAQRYAAGHTGEIPRGRQIALVGDAELDEGAIWEALMDPMVAHLDEVLWIVDLNRQSLDRVVPDMLARRVGAMFTAAGWNTITVKYGSELRGLFTLPGGSDLERRFDTMSNGKYQHALRAPAAELRRLVAGTGASRPPIEHLLKSVSDEELSAAIRDLGGHDLKDLLAAYKQAAVCHDRPTVIFAYTIKGWRLPTQGHPDNHSALLTDQQWRDLGTDLG